MTLQLDSPPALAPAIYAKQPIFDQQLTVMGFELLFRPSDKVGLIDDQLILGFDIGVISNLDALKVCSH